MELESLRSQAACMATSEKHFGDSFRGNSSEAGSGSAVGTSDNLLSWLMGLPHPRFMN